MAEGAKVLTFQSPKKRARLAYLIDQYHRAHPDEDPATVEPHLVADWATKTGVYKPEPIDPALQLRRDVARYLRTEYTTDPQGREVRKHHGVVYEVQTPSGIQRHTRYFEIYDATAEHMKASLQLRRRAALRDVLQLNLDFESWQDNNKHGETMEPMDYNFNPDVAETKLPTTYPDAPDPDDDFDEDDNIN
jgi:hypothetical protein